MKKMLKDKYRGTMRESARIMKNEKDTIEVKNEKKDEEEDSENKV